MLDMRSSSLVLPTCILVVALVQTPQFASELWPEEGRPRFAIRLDHTPLRLSPSNLSASGPVLALKPGTEITFDDTRYLTVRPGIVLARQNTTLHGRNFGKITYLSTREYYSAAGPTVTLRVSAGARFEYLQYRAEGTCFVRVNGDVIDADDCPDNDDHFAILSQPVTEWWIHIALPRGIAGWLLVDTARVTFLERAN